MDGPCSTKTTSGQKERLRGCTTIWKGQRKHRWRKESRLARASKDLALSLSKPDNEHENEQKLYTAILRIDDGNHPGNRWFLITAFLDKSTDEAFQRNHRRGTLVARAYIVTWKKKRTRGFRDYRETIFGASFLDVPGFREREHSRRESRTLCPARTSSRYLRNSTHTVFPRVWESLQFEHVRDSRIRFGYVSFRFVSKVVENWSFRVEPLCTQNGLRLFFCVVIRKD